MKPSAIAVDFGTNAPDPPSQFEAHYPPNDWTSIDRDEDLPLHYMSEEKARRRVKGPSGTAPGEYEYAEKSRYTDYYDDEGKDVYNKPRAHAAHMGGGRPPQPPLPPPTSLVSRRITSNVSKHP